jgi:FG-GAP-like repeat/FG-GAP repeat
MPSTLTGRQRIRHSSVAACSVLLLCTAGCGGSGSVSGVNGQSFVPTSNLYWSVAVADLNGDGKPDLAVSYSSGLDRSSPHQGFVAVFLQNPAAPATFLAPIKYGVGDNPVSIAIADLNGDGKPDIVVVNTELGTPTPRSDTVSVLLQDPNSPGQFLPAVDYPTGRVPNAIAVADLNGDGKPDLAVADTTGISILLQSSSAPGAFPSLTTLPLAAPASSVAIADLNGDNKLDLAAASGPSISVFLQNPAAPGTFSAPNTYAAGLQPTWVVVADFNGDAKPDLAVANQGATTGGGGSVSILLQDPTLPGGFLSARNYDAGAAPAILAVADLNADNRPDLVVGGFGNNVSVLLQDPSLPGQFQAAATYAQNGPVTFVAVADVNGDAKPDLITACEDGLVLRLQDPAHPGAFLSQTILAK